VVAAVSGVAAIRLLDVGLRRFDRRPSAAPPRHSCGRVVLGGDAGHNFADGLLLGATFALDPLAGLAATLAILAHELGQELGDLGILLDSGYSLPQAMRLNLLSALAALPGALLGFALGAAAQHALPFLHVFVASTFAYLIAVHLVPRLQRRRRGPLGGLALWGLTGVLWTSLFTLQHLPDGVDTPAHAAGSVHAGAP
jgi:zinc transporter ZupT